MLTGLAPGSYPAHLCNYPPGLHNAARSLYCRLASTSGRSPSTYTAGATNGSFFASRRELYEGAEDLWAACKGARARSCDRMCQCAFAARVTHRPSPWAAAPLEGLRSYSAVEDLPLRPGDHHRHQDRRRRRCRRRTAASQMASVGGLFVRAFEGRFQDRSCLF